MIDLAPHALHHIVIGSFIPMYARSRGAGIGDSSGAVVEKPRGGRSFLILTLA
jgi:hypothetical protein